MGFHDDRNEKNTFLWKHTYIDVKCVFILNWKCFSHNPARTEQSFSAKFDVIVSFVKITFEEKKWNDLT